VKQQRAVDRLHEVPPVGKSELLVLLLILAGAVLLAVLYLGELRGTPELDFPPVDEGFILYHAHALATGDWSLPPQAGGRDPEIRRRAYLRPPGYPFVLAGLYRLTGGDALALRAVQMALGLIGVVLAWFLGRRLRGPALGLTWAALMVFNWPMLYFRGGLNGAWLVILLLLVLTTIVFRIARTPEPRWAAAGGAVLGLLALVRPNALTLAPVLIGWGWWILRRRGLESRFVANTLAAAITGALILAPATIRNFRVEGALVPVSANGGLTLYHGNNDDATGFSTSNVGRLGILSSPWVIPDIIARVSLEEGRDLTFSEVSRILGRRARKWMIDHPGREMELLARRTALFWGPDPVAHNHAVGADRIESPLLSRIPIGFSQALGGALVGLAIMLVRRRRPGTECPHPRETGETLVAVVLVVVMWFVSFLPFFATSLYRTPLIPFLLLGSAIALVEIGRCVRRKPRAAATWIAALAVSIILTRVPIVRADPGIARRHYDRGLAWMYHGRPDLAETEFRQTLDIDPRQAAAHNGLGKILLDRGKTSEALDHFTSAARLQPKDPVARFNRGLALTGLGRWGEALSAFEISTRWAPTNAEAWTDVGICRERLGDLSGAVTAYETALENRPDHVGAANNLAWILATSADSSLRDGPRAVELARRVVNTDPSPSTLDTLAAALAEAGDFVEAAAVAHRALENIDDPSSPLAVAITARLDLFTKEKPFRQPPTTGGPDATQP